jgi:uncharacterized membrane protein
MSLVPEARTAILRTAAEIVVAIICIVAAIRTKRRWARVVLIIVATLITLSFTFGIFIIYLILRHGPR